MRLRGFPLFLMACLVLASCSADLATTESAPPQAPAFRVIGYVSDTGAMASPEQLDQLTHVTYAFALPQADGTLHRIANPWKLTDYVELANERDIGVLISVGGWGWDDEFEQLAASPRTRATFVAEVVAMVEEFDLHGADIDWEYPDRGASSEAFTALMTELRAALPPDVLLTAAVAALGPNADGVADEAFDTVDFLNVMAYDGGGAQHSPMTYAEDALAYWAERGLAPEKTVLGVPFYSRPQEVAYRDLVEADPDASDADVIEYYSGTVNYNGLATMRRKTELALERASGIMFWKLHDDTTDGTSLLRAIHDTVVGVSD